MKTNYFTAEKKPLYFGDSRKKLMDKVAIVRSDTKECIGIVGPDFKIVDDNELLGHFGNIATKLGIKWNIVDHHEIRGGKKTITQIEFPDIQTDVYNNKKDMLHCRSYLTNGYDGYSSAKLMFGFFRTSCKNSMVIGHKDMIIGYKHVGEVNNKLIEQFGLYITKRIAESKKQILQLHNITFVNENEIEHIVERTEVLGKSYVEPIMEALEKEKVARPLTAWALYNAYTYVITHVMEVNAEARLNKLKQLNIASLNWK